MAVWLASMDRNNTGNANKEWNGSKKSENTYAFAFQWNCSWQTFVLYGTLFFLTTNAILLLHLPLKWLALMTCSLEEWV